MKLKTRYDFIRLRGWIEKDGLGGMWMERKDAAYVPEGSSINVVHQSTRGSPVFLLFC